MNVHLNTSMHNMYYGNAVVVSYKGFEDGSVYLLMTKNREYNAEPGTWQKLLREENADTAHLYRVIEGYSTNIYILLRVIYYYAYW